MKTLTRYHTTRIRQWLAFFMIALVISGLTAIDVTTGLIWLSQKAGNTFAAPFITNVKDAAIDVGSKYAFLFYGYDWLAFAHIVIAVVFVGPYKDPVKNEWVIQFGIIACLMILPFALLMGHVRNIPIWWRIIDMSFGIIGILPLLIVKKHITFIKQNEAVWKTQTSH